jgi:hypothetical protein
LHQPQLTTQAKGRVERSFLTDQDRLIKQLRLAKVKTMQGANEFLEKEYWPEWNAKFARAARGEEDLHRPLAEGFELGSALSHVEHRIITNNYTFAYYSKNYQIVREDVQSGMKRQSLRVELRLSRKLRQTVKTLLAVRCKSIVPDPGTVLGWACR